MNDKSKNGQTITDAPIITEVPKAEIPKVLTVAEEKVRCERQHFIDEAFLKALPITLTLTNWTRGGGAGTVVTINTQADRIKLAWEIAQEAYTTRLTVKG